MTKEELKACLDSVVKLCLEEFDKHEARPDGIVGLISIVYADARADQGLIHGHLTLSEIANALAFNIATTLTRLKNRMEGLQ